MSDEFPRISLSFGAFHCEIEGIADPVPVLQRLVAFCEDVETRNPDFGRHVIPLDELNLALKAEGPVAARVEDGMLVLEGQGDAASAVTMRRPANPAEVQPPKPRVTPDGINSIKDIEEKAQDLPDAQLASALDRAMTEGAAKPVVPSGGGRSTLSVADYAMPRMPRNAEHALEIAAAWRHHIRGEAEFDRQTLISDSAQIRTRTPHELPDRVKAFDALVAQAVLRPVEGRDAYTLSPAVVERFAR